MFYGVLQEGFNYLNLDNSQKEAVTERLNKEYFQEIKKIIQKELSKFPKLKKVSNISNNGFRGICCFIIGFGNYAYREQKNRELTEKELIQLTNEFVSDCNAYTKIVKAQFSKIKFKCYLIDENVGSAADFKKLMIEYIKQDGGVPSNGLDITVYPTDALLKSLVQTMSQVSDAKKAKYEKLYEGFVKFVKQPHTLSGDFWSGHISDICKIVKKFKKIPC